MSSAACQTASICAQVVFWGEVLNANRMNPTVVQVLQSCRDGLRYDVSITLLAAGLIFLLALVLGVWKYRQVLVSDDHRAHPYVDIAHRSALLYSFATLLLAVFVEPGAWPAWVQLTAAVVVVFFFVGAIGAYIIHGALRDTTNQFEHPTRGSHVAMVLLIVG